ncbi:MAG: hypothetical protein EP330_11590 [Deltaproteobacteria bacterium]|nr:MAG: hypothetical protein EP330_11590 [Deltaproteobacteria bacterium]
MLAWLLAQPTVLAQDEVCLSDGQELHGPVARADGSVTLALPEGNVRVPDASTGVICPRPLTWEVSRPSEVRQLTLTNGEILLGAPRQVGGTVYLRLLDDHELAIEGNGITRWNRYPVDRLAPGQPPPQTRPRRHPAALPIAIGFGATVVVGTSAYLLLRNARWSPIDWSYGGG